MKLAPGTKSIIDLNDLRTISLKRSGKELSFDGKLHVLIGVVSFELKASIVNLTEEELELHINKVKVSNVLSLRDFTMFLAKNILTTKSLSMNGDNLVIKLK